MSSIIEKWAERVLQNRPWRWFLGLYVVSIMSIGLFHSVSHSIIQALK